jgi:hypothetical protein
MIRHEFDNWFSEHYNDLLAVARVRLDLTLGTYTDDAPADVVHEAWARAVENSAYKEFGALNKMGAWPWFAGGTQPRTYGVIDSIVANAADSARRAKNGGSVSLEWIDRRELDNSGRVLWFRQDTPGEAKFDGPRSLTGYNPGRQSGGTRSRPITPENCPKSHGVSFAGEFTVGQLAPCKCGAIVRHRIERGRDVSPRSGKRKSYTIEVLGCLNGHRSNTKVVSS